MSRLLSSRCAVQPPPRCVVDERPPALWHAQGLWVRLGVLRLSDELPLRRLLLGAPRHRRPLWQPGSVSPPPYPTATPPPTRTASVRLHGAPPDLNVQSRLITLCSVSCAQGPCPHNSPRPPQCPPQFPSVHIAPSFLPETEGWRLTRGVSRGGGGGGARRARAGSFFSFRPHEGSFEANPPFDDATVGAMAAHMDDLLGAAGAGPLSFAVIIPHLPDQDGWRRAAGSPHCRRQLVLRAGEHGYFEGAQHDRINRYRVAVFDTRCQCRWAGEGRA